jgi:hypothetical protein
MAALRSAMQTHPFGMRYEAVRYLSDHLPTQAEECYRLAKEARDKWVANILDNVGNQLHARADQLEAKGDGENGGQD